MTRHRTSNESAKDPRDQNPPVIPRETLIALQIVHYTV